MRTPALSSTDKLTVESRNLLVESSVLVIPGWNGSGPGHWQTLWQQQYPHFRRVEQHNWERPTRQEWVAQIDSALHLAPLPTFLVAHSLGCLAVAHWAASAGKRTDRVNGAFLVAPPWLAEDECSPAELADFLPMPAHRLLFPSVLVASENDHYMPIAVASRLAAAWGSRLVNVGRQGHINIASGHGPWPEGEALLRRFVLRTTTARSRARS